MFKSSNSSVSIGVLREWIPTSPPHPHPRHPSRPRLIVAYSDATTATGEVERQHEDQVVVYGGQYGVEVDEDAGMGVLVRLEAARRDPGSTA